MCIQECRIPVVVVSVARSKVSDDPDEEAPLFEAMAHPFRIAIRNELRKENGLTIAELRRRVSESYEEIDTRNIQFHLFRMQTTGVVRVEKVEKKDVVTLVKDVGVLLRELDA